MIPASLKIPMQPEALANPVSLLLKVIDNHLRGDRSAAS
jgi:hypothetical protein